MKGRVMRRRMMAFLGALALIISGLLTVATPAQAVSRDGVCDSGELCMWQAVDFRGGRYDTASTTANFQSLSYVAACSGCALDNTVSSLINRDAVHPVRLFDHANYQGLYFWRQKAWSGDSDQAQNLTLDRDQNGDDWNDRFSSFCFVYAGQSIARCRP